MTATTTSPPPPNPPVASVASSSSSTSSFASSAAAQSLRGTLFSSWQKGIVTSVGACCGIGVVAFLLWQPFKEDSVHQTAVVASEALGDVKVREQAVMLSKEVVANVLRDPKSLELVVHVVAQLLQQEDTRTAVTSFIKGVFEDHYTKEVTRKFVVDIVDSRFVRDHLDLVAYDLVMNLLHDPKLKVALSKFLLEATGDALREPVLHARTASALRSTAYMTVNPWSSTSS